MPGMGGAGGAGLAAPANPSQPPALLKHRQESLPVIILGDGVGETRADQMPMGWDR